MKNRITVTHHRKSIRLKGYDYTREGLYFITICTKNRQHYFGEITQGEMILTEPGQRAEMFLDDVSAHFTHAWVAEHVVMPNHVHLILVLDGGPCRGVGPCHGVGPCRGVVGPCHGMALPTTVGGNQFGNPIPGSVSVIVNQYKSSVKRWCNKNGYEFFQWQSRFYDHIIRNEKSHSNIARYIDNNPGKWENDKFHLK